MSELAPVFLFSLPRSGSTLLQRILATHPAISTASEPWILLPFLYAWRTDGLSAEYNHGEYVKALEDFCARLPGDRNDYRLALRAFALELYGKAAPSSAKYFLDKTPRYHLVAREILDVFPGCKAIFLWRDPIAIAASMIETWSQGKWNLHRFKVDLYKGLASLVDVYCQESKGVCSVRYEDLVTKPETQVQRILQYLELPGQPTLLDCFHAVRLEGRMGDRTGVESYSSVADEPLNKWQGVMNNPLRKAWARRYLRWIGEDRLAAIGYSMSDSLKTLADAPQSTKFLLSDAARMCLGPAHYSLKSASRALRWSGPR